MSSIDWNGKISRRVVLTWSARALAISALALPAATGWAQEDKALQEVPVDELMKTGDLADLALGPPEAKVTIVEYASMTCSHCMRFHTNVFPELKKKYIDTNKVRFIFREFPLDPRAFAASMLARCAGSQDKTFGLISALFDTQAEWAFVKENPKPKLFEVVKQAGFTQESFDKCLTDQKLLDQLTAIRSRADEKFGINSTPTFFINGKRLASPKMEEFDKVIEPLLSQG
jgi:protein-disulfide isomerase